MSDTQILTSIVVPAATHAPSLANLQWSEDGQAFVLTRGAIYILTPNTGINFEPSSVIVSSLSYPTGRNVNVSPLCWYRTVIELEKTPAHHWPFESLEWGTVSLGSLDMSWDSFTLSPSNLSQLSSCLLVTLNTNLEVSLWTPRQNHLIGEWCQIQDVTQALKEMEPTSSSALLRTLNAQVHSISWSQQIDVGEGTDHIDGSLLALGNRAGNVVFMQLSTSHVVLELQLVATVDVSDDWIHHLAWSVWRRVGPNKFQASVACGTPDGGIVIISVSLLVEQATKTSAPTLRFQFELQNGGKSISPADNNTITAMKWIETDQNSSILAYIKPGLVCLQSFASERPLDWTGRCVLDLKLQPLSSSSTPYAAASGLVYYKSRDALMVCLYDGSFHMIDKVSKCPFTYSRDQSLSSEELTRQVRRVFAISENEVSFSDANATSGVCGYDETDTIMWLHEKINPEDFSYMHDAKHASMIVVARLWRDDEEVLEELVSQFTGNHNYNFDASPVHVLRGVFLHLNDNKFLESHRDHIFELLVKLQRASQTASVTSTHESPQCENSNEFSLRMGFRRRLVTEFFRRRHTRSLRIGFVLASFCSSLADNASSSFSTLAEDLSASLLCNHLETVIQQISYIADQLNDNDRNFLHRWVTHSLAQGSPRLRDVTVALAQRVGVPTDTSLESSHFLEQCPACGVVISLGNCGSATCSNGHIWARCSISFFLLATPFVRTCVGCRRKALLPSSSTLPSKNGDVPWLSPAATSWLVQEILEAARWCIFCGNRFVRVL